MLGKYRGPEIPRREWEDLTHTTYATDPATFFAPITSATGTMELKGFWSETPVRHHQTVHYLFW